MNHRKLLKPPEIQVRMERLPEWTLSDQRIEKGARLRRTFRFPSFSEAIAFMVAVAFEAERIESEYPEAGEREIDWFPPAEAAQMVEEPGLAAILRDFSLKRTGRA